MNDLLTEQGQQRTRVIRQIIDTTQRSRVNRNQIQLLPLEPSDLGYKIGSFSTTQYLRQSIGQLKVNNNQVMCHLSMKLSDTFDQMGRHKNA